MRPVPRPFKIDPLEAALDRLVGSTESDFEVSQAWEPFYDVKETPTETTIFVDLPGVDEDEISIEEITGSIEVSVRREFDHDTEDAEEYTRLGRPYGAFVCRVPLSPKADAEEMTAKYRRGVLKIRVPTRRA